MKNVLKKKVNITADRGMKKEKINKKNWRERKNVNEKVVMNEKFWERGKV